MEIAFAFRKLKQLSAEEGGAKQKRGPKPSGNSAQLRGYSEGESRDNAADILGVKRGAAERLETVYTTPNVPKALQDAVTSGAIAGVEQIVCATAEIITEIGPPLPAMDRWKIVRGRA